jgi:hypothetical protein
MRFYEAIRYGAKIKHACQFAGIQLSTYYTWRRRAHAGEEPYATFVRGVSQAQGEFVARNLEAIHAHTAIDWKAAAWLLERSYPEEYAMRTFIEEEPPLLRDLKELISAGLVTVLEIRKEIPDLPPDQMHILMALEAQQMIDAPPDEIINITPPAQTLPQQLQHKLDTHKVSGDSTTTKSAPVLSDVESLQ